MCYVIFKCDRTLLVALTRHFKLLWYVKLNEPFESFMKWARSNIIFCRSVTTGRYFQEGKRFIEKLSYIAGLINSTDADLKMCHWYEALGRCRVFLLPSENRDQLQNQWENMTVGDSLHSELKRFAVRK